MVNVRLKFQYVCVCVLWQYEAHNGQKNYDLQNEQADIIGFFSTKHQAIFTHHDTFLHMHLITVDRKKMGHLDEALFKKGTISLFLPEHLK